MSLNQCNKKILTSTTLVVVEIFSQNYLTHSLPDFSTKITKLILEIFHCSYILFSVPITTLSKVLMLHIIVEVDTQTDLKKYIFLTFK